MKRRHFVKIFVLVAILVAGVGASYSYRYLKDHLVTTKEFGGNLQSIKDSSIVIKGWPLFSGSGTFQNIGTNPEKVSEVEVSIYSTTKIARTTFHIPSADQLKKTKGMFEPSKLPHEQSTVTFDTLKDDFKTTHYTIGIKIISLTDVVGRQTFVAKEVDYIFPIQ